MHLHIQDIALCSMIVVHSGICKHTHTSNLAHVLREESIKYLQSTWWLRSLYKVHEDKRDHLCLIETLLHFLSPNSPRRPHLTGSICTLHWQVPATLGRACCVAATPPLVVVVAFTSKKCRLWSLKKKSSLKCIALAPASSGSSACIQWCKPRALHDAAPARTMVSVSRPASMLLLSPFRFSRYSAFQSRA